jgi:hypothetical protein
MQRLFQDSAFVVTEMRGLHVEQLLGVTIAEDNALAMVLLKPRNVPWQRFFIDVCCAVWERDEDLDLAEFTEEEELVLVDYAAQFGLLGASIVEARCDPVDSVSSRILLRLSAGEFELGPREADTPDPTSVVSFRATPGHAKT